MSESPSLAIGAIGKIPSAGDYVRLGERGGIFEGFLDWMVEASEAAGGLPAEGAWHAFAYVHAGALLAGVVAPSRDLAGRPFPLAVASRVDARGWAEDCQLAPLILEPVWAATSELLPDLVGEEPSSVGPWQLEDLPSLEQARAAYEEWTWQATTRSIVDMVFGGDGEAAARAIATFHEALEPCVGLESPQTRLVMKTPLGQAGGAAVCFWLDLARRLLGWRQTLPSFFWSHDGASGSLSLPLGSPPPSLLSNLWMPEVKPRETCDVAEKVPDWEPARLAAWGERLSEADVELARLLSEFELPEPKPSQKGGWWRKAKAWGSS